MKFVIPAKAESSYFNMFWTPAFAGVTTQETFYETIILTPSLLSDDS